MSSPDVTALIEEVATMRRLNPEWRYGQTWYNVLRRRHPDLADRVHTTELDTFDRDDRVPRLANWLAAGAHSEPQRRP